MTRSKPVNGKNGIDSNNGNSSSDPVPQLRPYQWKKGVSGNPGGRPKGTFGLTKIAQELSDDVVSSVPRFVERAEQLGLDPDKTTLGALLIATLYDRILDPNPLISDRMKALEILWNRLEGKVPDRIEGKLDGSLTGAFANLDLSKASDEDLRHLLEVQDKCRVQQS